MACQWLAISYARWVVSGLLLWLAWGFVAGVSCTPILWICWPVAAGTKGAVTMAFRINIISKEQLQVEISEDCAPLVRNPDGQEVRDWANAQWPSDEEIAEQASAAYGCPVQVKFSDAIGTTALYAITPSVRRVTARKRHLNSRGRGTEEFLLAQDGELLIWATQHSRSIITHDDWCARGIRASERRCQTTIELPVGTLVVAIVRDVGGRGSNCVCSAGIVSADKAHSDGVDWEDSVKHVGRRKQRTGTWIHVLTINGHRREFPSS
jgi:hypothetical protein